MKLKAWFITIFSRFSSQARGRGAGGQRSRGEFVSFSPLLLCPFSPLLVLILGWMVFSSVCQAQLTSNFPPGGQGQLSPSTPLPSGFGSPQAPASTSPLGPINQGGVGFGGPPGPPIPFGGPPGPPIFANNTFSPGPSSLSVPSGTQGFIPGETSLSTPGGVVTNTPRAGFVTEFTGPRLGTSVSVPPSTPTVGSPRAVSSFPVIPTIILSPNAPLILNASLSPVVFRSSQAPAFTFRSGTIQNIKISVEVWDPDGVGDITEINFDFFTDSGLIPRALFLGQTHILRRVDANRAIFGIENLSLGNITPQALLPFITAFDSSGNRSNTWPFVSFIVTGQ